MLRQGIHTAAILRALLGDDRKGDVGTDGVARGFELLGRLPELRFVRRQFPGPQADDAGELARHARSLGPEQNGGAGQRSIFEAMFAEQREIQQRAKQVIWLNPENRMTWGFGDSEMDRYAPFCTLVEECRNLNQLYRVIDRLVTT